MVEDRSVSEQTHEIINLEHALADVEMKLLENFLVMSIVDKFPKLWKNFGMTLKHQKGRLSLDDLMIAINIEEEHRNQTHKTPVEHQPKTNLIVGKQRVNNINSNSKVINKGKTAKNKKLKANKSCWNCGQVGHWAKLCPNKKAKIGQAVVHMVVRGSSGASTSGATKGYVSVQLELLTIYEPCDWLFDTRANVHVCADKSLFVSYQAITGKTVSMGNSNTAEVLAIGSIDLKFTSERILSLKRVHHVPTVRRNIISVMARKRYDIVLHMFDEQDVLPRVDPRNVVTAEVHVWIHAELITPLGAELHVIDLDAEEDVQTDGVEAEGVDQEAESVDKEAESANETHVEDDENAMQDECDSARGAGQTNEDEDDGLMSGYSSDDAPLDAVSENEGDEDDDEGEDEDEDEPEDPMKNYLHRNMYEGAEGEDQKNTP
ncbi:UNVERIFIED_CONTAM: hypothetical protein Sradi_2637200 [Sesamum radiatum]|uniref:CCHC-type domain-containing protein n=1 Tax=Sesamum radiatum TaxID=300843 RepID=A0AAW2S4Z8_SESRA